MICRSAHAAVAVPAVRGAAADARPAPVLPHDPAGGAPASGGPALDSVRLRAAARPAEVLVLWTACCFDDLTVLPVLAAAIFIFRSQAVRNTGTPRASRRSSAMGPTARRAAPAALHIPTARARLQTARDCGRARQLSSAAAQARPTASSSRRQLPLLCAAIRRLLARSEFMQSMQSRPWHRMWPLCREEVAGPPAVSPQRGGAAPSDYPLRRICRYRRPSFVIHRSSNPNRRTNRRFWWHKERQRI